MYPSLKEAEAAVQVHALSEGFTVSRKRSKVSKSNEVRKVWLTCAHGGKYKNSREYLTEESRKRQRSSRVMDCPFSAIIQRIAATGDQWEWHINFDRVDHNHDKNQALLSYPAARKLQLQEQETVKSLTDVAATPKIILAALRQTNADRPLIPRDIYNERAKIRNNRLNGRTPIEMLLDHLHVNGIEHNYTRSSNGCITKLFFAPTKAVALAKEFPTVLLMDSTYKTNR